jgi:hypothetical protein
MTLGFAQPLALCYNDCAASRLALGAFSIVLEELLAGRTAEATRVQRLQGMIASVRSPGAKRKEVSDGRAGASSGCG